MEEFKQLVLGDVSIWYYFAAEFFALLALILSLYLHSLKRDPQSATTPVKYSVLFLVWDNLKRILAGQIVLFLLFRFVTELLGRELSMWMAVGIGFFLSLGIDKAIQFLKDKAGLFTMNREKMIDTISTTGNKT
jgi:hypothetical protein